MYYINDQGIVIEALQWDGSEESAKKIKKTFNLMGRPFNDYLYRFYNSEILFSQMIRREIYLYKSPIDGKLQTMIGKSFERLFKPISDARVLMIKELKKDMFRVLSYNADKDADWRNWKLTGLHSEMMRIEGEFTEYLKSGESENQFDKGREIIARIANCAAMIHDKLNSMELDAMHENRRKDD